jgi:hypothetical protein
MPVPLHCRGHNLPVGAQRFVSETQREAIAHRRSDASSLLQRSPYESAIHASSASARSSALMKRKQQECASARSANARSPFLEAESQR